MLEPQIPDDEKDRLLALNALGALDTPREERFDRIVRTMKALFDVPIAFIALVDEKRLWLKSNEGLSHDDLPRDTSFCGHCILQKGPLIIPDAKKDIRFLDNPLVDGEPHIRYYAGWPLSAPNGQNIGTLCMVDQKPRDYPDEEQMRIFRDLAAMAEDGLTLTDLAGIQTSLRDTNQALEKRTSFIRKIFGRYMADELVEALLDDPTALAMGGQPRTATVMMTDLRGFTPLTNLLDPKDVVEALNIYFAAMLDIIARHGGTVDNIIGDGLVVLFGVPEKADDDADRAIACAIEMQETMKEVNLALKAHDLPELGVGIGINSGEVVVGNIGSDRFAKFSAIGAPVNIAARVESLSLPGQVLVTEETLRQTKTAIQVDGSLRVKAKGVAGHVLIHDVIAIDSKKSERAEPQQSEADL
ncbi:MAG: adenylate/guanylate cyclase domain-containing protein [Pseudomonadota bacterium]